MKSRSFTRGSTPALSIMKEPRPLYFLPTQIARRVTTHPALAKRWDVNPTTLALVDDNQVVYEGSTLILSIMKKPWPLYSLTT